MRPAVHMIAAVGQNGQIGRNGCLPWYEPDDLGWFRRMTTGGVLVMGHRTLAALAPVEADTPFVRLAGLPGRVVCAYRRHNTPSLLLEIIARRWPHWPIWIAGGARTYADFAPHVNGLRLISHIAYDGPADRFFPFDAYGMDWRGGAAE